MPDWIDLHVHTLASDGSDTPARLHVCGDLFVRLARRHLQKLLRKGVAELAHAPDRAVVLHGDDRHAAGMLHHFAQRLAPVRKLRAVEPDVHDDALIL